MGAAKSKVIPIHIPAGEECVPTHKAKRKWRKNFRLLSLLCCSANRPASPVAKKIPPCRTPPLYEHPYMVAESDIEIISLTSIPPPPMTVSDHCLTPPHSDSESNGLAMPNVCNRPQLNPQRIILSPLPDPGRSNPTPNHPKNRKKKDEGKQKSLKVEGSESHVKRCKTPVKKNPMTVGDHCLTPPHSEAEHNAELSTVQSNGLGIPPNPRRRIILPPLPDPGRSNPTPNHLKNKKKKRKGKQKALKSEGPESTVNRCKTSVKRSRATKLKENEAAATGPPSVRIPTPWPGTTRTPLTKQRVAKPKRHSQAVHSQDIDDSYTIDIARDGPVTITRNVSNASSLLPEVDETHSHIAGQQHRYPYPPQDRQLLPLRDSFDSLDSYTQLGILAGPNVDASSDEDDDDSEPTPGDDGTVSNNRRPKASYGTVTLQRKEGWLSSAPRPRTSIKCRRSNNMTEAKVRRARCEKLAIDDVDNDDKGEEKKPEVDDKVEKKPKNRLSTAIRRFRRTANSTRVSETSVSAEASTSATVHVAETSSDVEVIEISGPTEVAETSGQAGVTEPRRRARRLVLCPMDQQPHPFSVGFEGWRYELR